MLELHQWETLATSAAELKAVADDLSLKACPCSAAARHQCPPAALSPLPPQHHPLSPVVPAHDFPQSADKADRPLQAIAQLLLAAVPGVEEHERQEELRKQREAAQLARRNREVADLSRLFECATPGAWSRALPCLAACPAPAREGFRSDAAAALICSPCFRPQQREPAGPHAPREEAGGLQQHRVRPAAADGAAGSAVPLRFPLTAAFASRLSITRQGEFQLCGVISSSAGASPGPPGSRRPRRAAAAHAHGPAPRPLSRGDERRRRRLS